MKQQNDDTMKNGSFKNCSGSLGNPKWFFCGIIGGKNMLEPLFITNIDNCI